MSFSFLCYKRVLAIDPLCRVANYLFFSHHIESLYRHNLLKEFTIFFINLKDFKFVNNQFSRKGGDLVLYQYAQTLKNFTKHKEMVCRLGGDNFIAIIRTERVQEFLDLINEVVVKVHSDGEDFELPITCRAGICTGDEHSSPKDFTDKAASAFRFARENKILRSFYKPEMQEKMLRSKKIADKFMNGIKNQEFTIFYQAKTDMVSGKVVGAEALSRWQRPEGILYPNEYIPFLENEGSIVLLDFYNLTQVCKDIKKWQQMGIEPVKVSVNFSKINFHDENFVEHILEVLSEYEIDHNLIEVEITESAGYEDFDVLRKFVQKMNEEKIAVSIDDFGTGFSALNLIKQLPVNVVKLDKSFVNDVNLAGKESLDFLKNLVTIIKGRNMEVICEGVESETQKNILMDAGCKYAQGFLFSKPCDEQDFEDKYLGK